MRSFKVNPRKPRNSTRLSDIEQKRKSCRTPESLRTRLLHFVYSPYPIDTKLSDLISLLQHC